MTTRGLALGCGGTLGFAWTAVALQALERELDWDARDADLLIGTSAGAEMVTLLASGHSVDAITEALETGAGDPVVVEHLGHDPGNRPPLPGPRWPARGLLTQGPRGRLDLAATLAGLLPEGRGDATWLRDLGARCAGERGWLAHRCAWLVAADAVTGARVAFGAPGAPAARPGDALAASWAIPGWFPPVDVAGRRYLDGGTISSVSADLVIPRELDELVVVAPMTSAEPVAGRGLARVERLLRHRMTAGLDRELALVAASGTRIIRVEPGAPELAAMGFNFMDVDRRPATLGAARRHTPDRVRQAITRGAPA